jgi:predicted house-cleaning noncanonical NTP pyrophosphatase (MazG superfamily)
MQKLVRDLVPSLMRRDGVQHQVRVLHDDEEYLQALHAKLHEEIAEWEQDYALEELGDIIDVVLALRDHVNSRSYGELERIRAKKCAEKGGFGERRLLLLP